jgi:hypothetical protein
MRFHANGLDNRWPEVSGEKRIHITPRPAAADLDDERSDVMLLLHWAGGRHSKIRPPAHGPWVSTRQQGRRLLARQPRATCVQISTFRSVRQQASAATRFTDGSAMAISRGVADPG